MVSVLIAFGLGFISSDELYPPNRENLTTPVEALMFLDKVVFLDPGKLHIEYSIGLFVSFNISKYLHFCKQKYKTLKK